MESYRGAGSHPRGGAPGEGLQGRGTIRGRLGLLGKQAQGSLLDSQKEVRRRINWVGTAWSLKFFFQEDGGVVGVAQSATHPMGGMTD